MLSWLTAHTLVALLRSLTSLPSCQLHDLKCNFLDQSVDYSHLNHDD